MAGDDHLCGSVGAQQHRERPLEEPSRRVGAAVGRQQHVDDLSVLVDRAIHVPPLPELLALAKDQSPQRVLVVVDARSEAPDELVQTLRPVALVIVEQRRTPVADAFRVGSVPAFCVVDAGGEIRSVAGKANRLPVGELA